MKSVEAWHFLADSGKLRDSRPAVDGEWLLHTGPAVMCKSGLHASRKVTDALSYAPGSILCRVECRGVVEERGDKLLCLERKIIWRIDATDVLHRFARMCALDVIGLWDAPAVVVEFLNTGDASLGAAAGAAAWDAAWAAAWAAAGAAARAAAWAAAWDAADAARAAAWDARGARQERRLVALAYAEHKRVQGGGV